MEAKLGFYIEHDGDGRSDKFGGQWKPARIMHPKFEPREPYPNAGFTHSVCVDPDFIEGVYNMHASDFESHGRAYKNENGTFHVYVHSNYNFDLRFKQ
jgi:hypothetical protein